jgi:hypothetical protein
MKNRGGKRAGAGRKSKFEEKTKELRVRVPVSQYLQIKIEISELIKKYYKTDNQ